MRPALKPTLDGFGWVTTQRPSPAHHRPVPLRRQLRQGAPGCDGVGVVGAEDALADGEGALEEGAGGGRVALVAEEEGEPGECPR